MKKGDIIAIVCFIVFIAGYSFCAGFDIARGQVRRDVRVYKAVKIKSVYQNGVLKADTVYRFVKPSEVDTSLNQ